MKKLVLMLAVAFSVSLFSCGGSDAKEGVDSADSAAKADSIEKANTPAPEQDNAPVVNPEAQDTLPAPEA